MSRHLCWLGAGSLLFFGGCGDNSAYLPKPRPSVEEPEAVAQLPAPSDGSSRAPMPTSPTSNAPNAAPAASSVGPSDKSTASSMTNVSDVVGSAPGATLGSADPLPPAVQKMSDKDRRAFVINQLRRIATALENYRQAQRTYPSARVEGSGLSWRVALLPYLGRSALFERFHFNENWDSEHNKKLLREIPEEYRSPERNDDTTNFLLASGPGTASDGGEPLSEAGFRDGLENTILLVEVSDHLARPWTAPDDWPVNPDSLDKDLFSLRRDCCFAVLGGAVGVRRIPADIEPANLLALISPSGGENVSSRNLTAHAYPEVDHALIERLAAKIAAGTPSPESAGGIPSPDDQPTITSAPTPAVGAGVGTAPPKSAVDTPSPDVASSRKRGIPPDDLVEAASNLVRDLYGDEYVKAKTRDQRRDFAKKMLDESAKVGADDAGLYVLLRAARDIAVKAGDLATALDAADRMADEFSLDSLAAKLALLEQAMTNQDDESQMDSIHDIGLELGDEAVQLDRFDEAQRLYRLAMSAVRRGSKQDSRLGSRTIARRTNGIDSRETTLQERETHLQDAKRAYAKVSDRVHLLLREPDHPAANAAVGRYFCLIKDDWNRGLPMLARGDDETLRNLAALDLSNPAKPEDQTDLADQWWAWSEKTSVDLERASARRHARLWYEKALPQLPASLQKVRVEKRIADANSFTAPR